MSDDVPFLDLKAHYPALRDEIQAAVADVFEAQAFVLGQTVGDFEREAAAYCGAPHAVGVTSGTDALVMALIACGVGPGDEVITTPYSFFATASSIARLGAKPVFADIEPDSLNLNPELIDEHISPNTKAVIAVHLFGRCANMDAIRFVAGGLPVIEDAAQAIGAEWDGRRAGSLADVGCLSFYPTKNLGGAGDGGMLTTGDADQAARFVRMRNHGQSDTYHHEELGGNFRLDALQAAVLRIKLRHLDAWNDARIANAATYARLLGDTGLCPGPLRAPEAGGHRHIYHQYVVRTEASRRDALLDHLRAAGIGCGVYYPLPLHRQPCFAGLGGKEGDFPVSEAASRESISLPMFPELSEDQIARVVEAIAAFFK